MHVLLCFLNNEITMVLIDGRVARIEKMRNALIISMRKPYWKEPHGNPNTKETVAQNYEGSEEIRCESKGGWKRLSHFVLRRVSVACWWCPACVSS